METITLSKDVLKYYLGYVFDTRVLEKTDFPPDDINEYAPYVVEVGKHLKRWGDVELFRKGLEYLILCTDIDELESFNPSYLYGFDSDEIKEIVTYCYGQMFPDSPIPASFPSIQWENVSWTEWSDMKLKSGTVEQPPIPHLRDLKLTKAQFVALLERTTKESFDEPTLDYLNLNREKIEESWSELETAGLVPYGHVPLKLKRPIQAIHASTLKCVTKIRAEQEWMQVDLCFDDDVIAGVAINNVEERLLTELSTIEEAAAWLVSLIAPVGYRENGVEQSQSLETLLRQAEGVITLQIVDSAQEDEDVKLNALILLIKQQLWYVDNSQNDEVATTITQNLLTTQLSTAFNMVQQGN